jgi:hypothetical protein
MKNNDIYDEIYKILFFEKDKIDHNKIIYVHQKKNLIQKMKILDSLKTLYLVEGLKSLGFRV